MVVNPVRTDYCDQARKYSEAIASIRYPDRIEVHICWSLKFLKFGDLQDLLFLYHNSRNTTTIDNVLLFGLGNTSSRNDTTFKLGTEWCRIGRIVRPLLPFLGRLHVLFCRFTSHVCCTATPKFPYPVSCEISHFFVSSVHPVSSL